MKSKWRMNEAQIEKKAQSEANRIDQFQQRKQAEELKFGMVLRILRNTAVTALEQLGYKIKAEEIIAVSAKAEDEGAATWASESAEQKQQYPSRTLCYSVSLALEAPQAVKMEKQENRDRDISDCDMKQLCDMIRKERAKELARAGMANNAARRRRAMAVLKCPDEAVR